MLWTESRGDFCSEVRAGEDKTANTYVIEIAM